MMTETAPTNPNEPSEAIAALVAQYAGPDELLEAAAQVRDAGYRDWDTHSPFPVHGMDRAMGIRPTILPWLVLGAGMTGAIAAIGLQWWTNAIDFPYLISGKPLFSLPADIPVTFEVIVLFAALTTFFGSLALNRLPEFWHPTLENARFGQMTTDGFFLSIGARDPKFDREATMRLLVEAGAVAVEVCPEPVKGRKIPRGIYWVVATFTVLALLPPLSIAWYRSGPKRSPRLHPIMDMDKQPKYKTQTTSPLFTDGRADRPPVPGTVAQGDLDADTALYLGKVGEEWVSEFPIAVDMYAMQRGQERFGVYCAPCHGLAGDGNGMVAARAAERGEANWVPPLSIEAESVRQQPIGQIFNTITNGIRTMPAYGSQIPVEDRWDIVLYVKALQRSQQTTLDDVPADLQDKLR